MSSVIRIATTQCIVRFEVLFPYSLISGQSGNFHVNFLLAALKDVVSSLLHHNCYANLYQLTLLLHSIGVAAKSYDGQ